MSAIFIIQGPVLDYVDIVKKNIKTIKKGFENPIVYVQTTCHCRDLESFCQSNENVNYIQLNDVGSFKRTKSTRGLFPNLDRQINSSVLRECPSKPVILKLRSDLELKRLFFIRKAIKYVTKNPNKVGIVSITTTPIRSAYHGLYHVCDWVYVMNSHLYREVFKLEDLPVEPGLYCEDGTMKFACESYLTLKILKKIGYENLADNQFNEEFRNDWVEQYKAVFFMLPYLFTFKSKKYPRVWGNLINSHKFGIDIRSMARLIIG